MPNERRPEIGSTIALEQPAFKALLQRLREAGYLCVGPRVKNETLVYEAIESLDDLPRGYITEQDAASFHLKYTGHARYFDAIPGAQSWKQFLFPARTDLLKLRKAEHGWEILAAEQPAARYAFLGVRACELAAIQIQDSIFLRSDFNDPVYRARRENVFILSVNCLNPAGTCFCSSIGTGPRVKSGFDLNLTEVEGVFLLTVGSEVARDLLSGLPFDPASAFLLGSAERLLDRAGDQMGRKLDINGLPEMIMASLDHPHWREVGKRCLSCTNCTQVCPTCFCWDATDQMNLDGTETSRERVWDSCFNPGYSSQAGGNTRPSISSRYRQWLSHKLGSWPQQFGTLGCVGCGRCITWCPAKIDLTQEVPALRMEPRS